jgi:hypothetical protein
MLWRLLNSHVTARKKESYPNAATGPNFLNFAHKLLEGVIRDQPRVPVSIKLDQIAKILHLTEIHKLKIRRPKVERTRFFCSYGTHNL